MVAGNTGVEARLPERSQAVAAVEAAEREDIFGPRFGPEQARWLATCADHGLAAASTTPEPMKQPAARNVPYCRRLRLVAK